MIAVENREYRARLMIVEAAFRFFSRLAIECDDELRPPEWAVLDEARLPEGRVSLGELITAVSRARRRLIKGCPEGVAQKLGILRGDTMSADKIDIYKRPTCCESIVSKEASVMILCIYAKASNRLPLVTADLKRLFATCSRGDHAVTDIYYLNLRMVTAQLPAVCI